MASFFNHNFKLIAPQSNGSLAGQWLLYDMQGLDSTTIFLIHFTEEKLQPKKWITLWQPISIRVYKSLHVLHGHVRKDLFRNQNADSIGERQKQSTKHVYYSLCLLFCGLSLIPLPSGSFHHIPTMVLHFTASSFSVSVFSIASSSSFRCHCFQSWFICLLLCRSP